MYKVSHGNPPQALWGKWKKSTFSNFLSVFTFALRTKKITFFCKKIDKKMHSKLLIFNDFLFESKTKKLCHFKVSQFEIFEKQGCPLWNERLPKEHRYLACKQLSHFFLFCKFPFESNLEENKYIIKYPTTRTYCKWLHEFIWYKQKKWVFQ